MAVTPNFITNYLNSIGLGSLASFVDSLLVDDPSLADAGNLPVLELALRDRPEYKERFKGNEGRIAKGLPEYSAADYIRAENEYRAILSGNNLPPGFYDTQADFANFIGGNVSAQELDNRIQRGYLAVKQSDPNTIAEMKRLYGVDEAGLAAYFLDPTRGRDVVIQQAGAARVAGGAQAGGGITLTQQEAEQLAQQGITGEQSRQGFGAIQQMEELFRGAPGEGQITREEQISGVFGTNAAAQQRIRQRQARRTAEFAGGGGFAGQGTTVTGLQ